MVAAGLSTRAWLAGFASPAHALTVLAYPCYALVTLFVIEAIRAKSPGPDFQAARPIS